MSQNLDRAANIVVIVLGSILVAVLAATAVMFVRTTTVQASKTEPFYKAGENAEQPEGIRYADAKANVLVFLKDGCPACEASRSFHSSLVKEMGSLPGVRVVMLATAADPSRLPAMAQAIGVSGQNALPNVDPKVGSVPAILVLDSRGIVRDAWYGRLFAEEEQKVKDAVHALLKP